MFETIISNILILGGNFLNAKVNLNIESFYVPFSEKKLNSHVN